MNQKTLKIIALITGILLLIGAVGYFAFVSKPELTSEPTEPAPTSTSAYESTPTPSPSELPELPGSSSFFPIGLYCVDTVPYSNKVTEEFPDIAAAGFNLIQSYQFESTLDDPANTNRNARAFLDAADRSGLKVLMGIPEECVSKRNLACIRNRVSALKDHPALYGWQLYDEPELYIKTSDPVGDLTLAYQQIKQLDQRHPVTIAAADPVDANYSYREGADIVMTQLLVIPTQALGYGETPLGDVVRGTVGPAAALLKQEGKSTLPHVQAYNLATDPLIWSTSTPRSEGRYPTREEMRFSAYYSVILGAKGVFFNCYRYYYGGETPLDDISRTANQTQWRAVSSIASELRSLEPIILAPQSQVQVTAAPDNAGVEFLLKNYQDRLYLIAVNPKGQRKTIAFTFSESPAAVKVLNESRTIFPQGNSFTDDFAGYGVHVYEIRR